MNNKEISENTDIESELFLMDEKEYGENYKQHLLDQYKMYVEMTDRISERRSKTNTFFLSANTLLLTVAGLLFKLDLDFGILSLGWVCAVSIAGILFCWTWISTINSYKTLNSVETGKFRIIHMIESKLPLAMYKAEWNCLDPECANNKYKKLTAVEVWVPRIFALVYFILMAIAIILLIGSWAGLTIN